MKKSQLTSSQLKDLNLFILILECHGWEDYLETEKQLNEGKDVNPESVFICREGSISLEVQFHAPVQMISLSISDHSLRQKVDLFFIYEQQPELILEWIVTVKGKVELNNYKELLHASSEICKTILVAESSAEHIELKPLKA